MKFSHLTLHFDEDCDHCKNGISSAVSQGQTSLCFCVGYATKEVVVRQREAAALAMNCEGFDIVKDLTKRRTKLHKNVVQASREIGVRRQTLSRWEAGISTPKGKVLTKACAWLAATAHDAEEC